MKILEQKKNELHKMIHPSELRNLLRMWTTDAASTQGFKIPGRTNSHRSCKNKRQIIRYNFTDS